MKVGKIRYHGVSKFSLRKDIKEQRQFVTDQCARERVIISLLSRIFAIPWLANWKLWPFIIGPRGGGQERKGMRNKIVHAHNERSSPLKERCLCHN